MGELLLHIEGGQTSHLVKKKMVAVTDKSILTPLTFDPAAAPTLGLHRTRERLRCDAETTRRPRGASSMCFVAFYRGQIRGPFLFFFYIFRYSNLLLSS